MSTDGEDVGVRAPTWLNGFVAATRVGLVAVTAWLAAAHRYDAREARPTRLDAWLWPVARS